MGVVKSDCVGWRCLLGGCCALLGLICVIYPSDRFLGFAIQAATSTCGSHDWIACYTLAMHDGFEGVEEGV